MLTYIFLAVGCLILGVIFTFVMLFACHNLNVDIAKNLWVLALPASASIIINIFLVEIFTKLKKK
jgi:hypothetical protein